MKVANHLYGGSAYLESYQVNATFSNAGVPALIGTTNEAGVDLPTTTAAADYVGLTIDTATYQTAQNTDNSDPGAYVKMDIRPDVVIRARLSGDGTTGTALTLYDVTTASTDGLAVTTGDNWSCPTMVEGSVWGYDGANGLSGVIRKITSVSSSAATVTVAFPFDTAVGDNFLRCNFNPFGDEGTHGVTLTSDFLELDTSAAADGTLAPFHAIKIENGNITNDGQNKSYALIVPTDVFLTNSQA